MGRYRFGQRESRDRGDRPAACWLRRRRLQPGKGRGRPLDPDQQHAGFGQRLPIRIATSDQTTIGNAVSSADIEQLGGQAVPWANAGTGSRGSITELAELKDRGQTCRRFKASRESFDGVAMFEGELCLASAGGWRMQGFKAL